jgi:hypothetical protein
MPDDSVCETIYKKEITSHPCWVALIFSSLTYNYSFNLKDRMDTADSAYKLAVEKYETNNQQETSIGWVLPCTYCLFAIVFIALVS